MITRDCSAVTRRVSVDPHKGVPGAGWFWGASVAGAFQDVDLRLKLHDSGYRIIYASYNSNLTRSSEGYGANL